MGIVVCVPLAGDCKGFEPSMDGGKLELTIHEEANKTVHPFILFVRVRVITVFNVSLPDTISVTYTLGGILK